MKPLRSLRPSATAVRVVLFLALIAFSRWRCGQGLEWNRALHPDETTIAAWLPRVLDEGYLRIRAYPGGWFELFRVRAGADGLARALARAAAPAPAEAQDEPAPPVRRRYPIVDCRRFNAGLFALSVALVFAAGLEAGFGTLPASFGALLFSFLSGPLEFSHYCETDAALVFSFALFLWLHARALRLGRFRDFALAAAAAGFAVACKYTLAPLLAYPALVPCLLRGRDGASRRERLRAGAGAAAAAAALVAAGFVAGTPALRLDPAFFFSDMARVGRLTYGELAATLGDRARFWWAPYALRCGSLAVETLKIGWPALLWFAVSAACACRRDGRRLWTGAPLFTGVFLVYAVLAMPWIRSQETLAPIVALCTVGGAPLARAREWAAAAPDRRRRMRAAAAAGAAAAVLCGAFSQGARTLSAFTNADLRTECGTWLRMSADGATTIATDQYVLPGMRAGAALLEPKSRWHERDAAAFDRGSLGIKTETCYYVRNLRHVGRAPNRSLWTRRLLPEAADNVERFRARCPALLRWQAPRRARGAGFAQHHGGMHAVPRTEAGADLPPLSIAVDRPVLVVEGAEAPFLPLEWAPIGPVWARRTVGKRGGVSLPDLPAGEPVWGLVRSFGEPLGDRRVEWTAPFGRDGGTLSRDGAVAVRLSRAAYRLESLLTMFPTARVRIRGRGPEGLCAAWIATDPAAVARALRSAGSPEAALAAVRAAPDPTDAARSEAFLAALAAGVEPAPADSEAARRCVARFDALAARLAAAARGDAPFPAAASIDGAPLSAWLDFANVRLGNLPGAPGAAAPLVLPAGTARIRFEIAADSADWAQERTLFEGQAAPAAEIACAAPDRRRFEAVLSLRAARPLRLAADLTPPAGRSAPILHGVCLSWDPLEAIGAAAEELRAALAARPERAAR